MSKAPDNNNMNGASVKSHADLAEYDPHLCVIKLGSAVVTKGIGELDKTVLDEVAAFICRRLDRNLPTILVSSGAVAAGIGELHLTNRPERVPELQALAAVGQARLMAWWGEAFAQHNRHVAQVLVSAEDFRDRRRYLNMRYTFEKLFDLGVTPIINENDTITIEELRFGDNDGLGQLIAIKMMADLLVFLTGVGGLYRHMPAKNEEPELVEVINRVTPEILAMASGGKSTQGTGGMGSKLEAARLAASAGIPSLIAPGKIPGILDHLMNGKGGATLILPRGTSTLSRRQRFIAFSRVKPRGQLWVDAGAMRALIKGKKSLLPVGVIKSEGKFDRQNVVDVIGPNGQNFARGLTNYNSDETFYIMGRHSAEFERLLGTRNWYEEIIHRDNLVVLEESE